MAPSSRPAAAGLIAALVFVAAVTLGAVHLHQSRSSERDELARQVHGLLSAASREELSAADLAVDFRREPDMARVRSEAARLLVRDVLLRGRSANEAERARAVEGLELARRLASRSLAERPASGRAATALGAAVYLSRSLGRDDRLFTDAPSWEIPLWRGMDLTPADVEARRFLAIAYLELWPSLPDWKKEEARELVASGLGDRSSFPFLIGPWLAVSPSLEAALAPMPDRIFAWDRLSNLLADRGAWDTYRQVIEPWHKAVEKEGRAVLERAASARGRERAGELLEVIRALPVERRFAPLLADLLQKLPPGSAAGTERNMERWLAWSLELCLLGDCPLPDASLARLQALARPGDAPLAAAGALLAGRFTTALAQERRGSLPLDETWGPYLILKARYLLRHGEAAAAADTLARLPGPWRDHAAARSARLEVARTLGDGPQAGEIEARIEGEERRRWEADEAVPGGWDTRPERAFRVLRIAAGPGASEGAAPGGQRVCLELAGRPAAPMRVLWDGWGAAVISPPGALGRAGRAAVPMPPREEGAETGPSSHCFRPPGLDDGSTLEGLHALELRALGPGSMLPGAVWIETGDAIAPGP